MILNKSAQLVLHNFLYFGELHASVCFLSCPSVPDEESTIEEQEAMEGEADHKTELVDLAKDGTYSLFFLCVS